MYLLMEHFEFSLAPELCVCGKGNIVMFCVCALSLFEEHFLVDFPNIL